MNISHFKYQKIRQKKKNPKAGSSSMSFSSLSILKDEGTVYLLLECGLRTASYSEQVLSKRGACFDVHPVGSVSLLCIFTLDDALTDTTTT